MDLSVSAAAATALGSKCHLFKIESYKRIRIMYGNGKCLESCGFEVAGRTWRIQVYPDGKEANTAGFVSLYLKLDDDGKEGDTADGFVFPDAKEVAAGKKKKKDLVNDADAVMAEVKLALVRQYNRSCSRPANSPYSVSFTTTFTKNRKAVGYPKFIKREDFEKSQFLRDGCFAVRCDVAVLKPSVDAEEHPVGASDMERLDMVCDCNSDACKRRHLRGAAWLGSLFYKLFLECFELR